MGSDSCGARVALLVLTAAALTGCTQLYGLPVDEAATSGDAADEQVPTTFADRAPNVEPDPSQAEVLADGSVSAEEYRDTIDRFVACLAAGGVEALLTYDNDFQVVAGYSGPAVRMGDLDEVEPECRARYLDAVDAAASDEHSWEILLDHAEDVAGLRACLRSRGHDVDGLAESEIIDGMVDSAPQDLVECNPDNWGAAGD